MNAPSDVVHRREKEERSAHVGWGELLIIVGLIGTLVGSMEPIEGQLFIVPGVSLIALGTIVSKSQLAKFAIWSCVLTAIGVVCMIVLSALGGIGGESGLSAWWSVLLIPYAVGAVLGLIGGAVALIERLSDDGNPAQTRR